MESSVEGLIFHLSSSLGESESTWTSSRVHRMLERLSFGPLLLGGLCNAEGEVSRKEQVNLCAKLGLAIRLESQETSIAAALQALLAEDLWCVPVPATAVVIGSSHAAEFEQLAAHGWKVIHLIDGAGSPDASAPAWATVASLLDLPSVFVQAAKEANPELLVVGHCMKWSRERDFLKRGAFPLLPAADFCFLPIDLDRPLDRQMALVEVLLHKATDEIVRLEDGTAGPGSSRVKFSDGFCALERYLGEHPKLCVVDPLPAIMPLLDRATTQELLQGLPDVAAPEGCIVRPPKSVQVASFDEATIRGVLEEGRLTLPAIVKPLIACGAAESHTMAVVFRPEGFQGLPVPLPATIQEYVDHGAWQHKCYLLGSALFTVLRKSTPDAAATMAASGDEDGEGSYPPAVRVFDSLRSLPTTFTEQTSTSAAAASSEPLPESEALGLDRPAVERAGDWLRQKLGLTFLGFDIVVQKGTQDHVVIDVNYFPSFKDVPPEDAVPSMWKALWEAHRRHRGREELLAAGGST